MPNLSPRFPIVHNRPSRKDRISEEFPAAAPLCSQIEQRIEPFKYGSDSKSILNQYKVFPTSHAIEFFKANTRDQTGYEIDNLQLKKNLVRSVNIDHRMSSFRPENVKSFFAKSAIEMTDDIATATKKQVPLVRVIVGPTGAGKTAYSKALITLGLNQFWANGIVPTRIEYSKFFEDGSKVSEEQLCTVIDQCRARDALLWALYSEKSNEKIRAALISFFPQAINRFKANLFELIDLAEGKLVNEEGFTLGEANDQLKLKFDVIPSELASAILEIAKSVFDLKFLVSLDGFDVIEPADFLISSKKKSPANTVITLLDKVLIRFANEQVASVRSSSHFVVYIRQTTFSRVSILLKKRTGGVRDIQPHWIVPPPYEIMIDKVTKLVSGDMKSAKEWSHVGEFNTKVKFAFKQHAFRSLPPEMKGLPLGAFFTWNARNMQRHVKKILFFAIWNMFFENEAYRLQVENTGTNAEQIWARLMKTTDFSKIPGYQFVEELFLDDTHQLTPQISTSAREIEAYLEKKLVNEAVSLLDDHGETNGFFDCILNYLTKDIFVDGTNYCVPCILLPVRILQYTRDNKEASFFAIQAFLEELGYSISDSKLEYLIYVLLRNEHIGLRDPGPVNSLRDCQFFANASSHFLLSRLLPSVTYLGECIMVAELPQKGFRHILRGRGNGSDIFEWVESMIINSIVAYNAIYQAERFEIRNAMANNNMLQKYQVSAIIRSRIQLEIEAILSSPSREMRRREGAMRQLISELKMENFEFDHVIT